MPSFLNEELGVAMSGVKWDIGNFKLWQSTRDDIILFTTKQPTLAKGENGRYQAAVSAYHQQREGTYKITSGSALFTITSAVQFNQQAFDQLKEQWRAEVVGSGQAKTRNPRFIPLNIRKGQATVLINRESGTPDEAHNKPDVGTPGGTNSFLVNLTELGAQEWVQGIKSRTAIPAGVKFMYEYLQMLPTVGATVTLHGRRAFRHLSTALNVSYDGWLYGGSAKIDAAWENMTREGIVEITFQGTPPPEVAPIQQSIVTTFATQAQQMWFNMLFEKKPDVKPAEAGSSGGWFGGANFALKWRSETETVDLNLVLKFEGWTWLQASMDADLTTLFANLDASYVTEVQTQQSFPASVVVDSDPLLESVALSWSASEGKSPESPVFGPDGGTAQYVVTSQRPDDVNIRYKAKVNFTPASWPIIEDNGAGKVIEGGNQVVVKPSSWVGRHMIFMFVRDGDRVLPLSELTEDDYLVANVSYTAPHLRAPIKASAKITPLEPLEFSFPRDPKGGAGEAKFSAFGVIGQKMVRSKGEQVIKPDEEAVFILASKDDIQLVSKDSIISESDDLAQRLLEAGARPVVSGDIGSDGTGRRTETTRRAETERGKTVAGYATTGEIKGTVVAVEYSYQGPAVIVEDDGSRKRVRLRTLEEARVLDDGRKNVDVVVDDAGFAERITVLF